MKYENTEVTIVQLIFLDVNRKPKVANNKLNNNVSKPI